MYIKLFFAAFLYNNPIKSPPSMHHVVLPNGSTGTVSEHARGNVHRLQLLEQEFCRIRNVNLRNLGLVLAGPAFKRLLGKVPIIM